MAVLERLSSPQVRYEEAPLGRVLDDYIEAQVHGELDLARDVEALVVDPCFALDPVLQAISRDQKIALHCHGGFLLRVADVPDDFRGPRMPSLAREIAGGAEFIDVSAIGAAVRVLDRGDPSYDEALQHLKQLWHVMVRYGQRRTGNSAQEVARSST